MSFSARAFGILCLAGALTAACAHQYVPVSLQAAVVGEDLPPRVEIEGSIHSINMEVFSLLRPGAAPDSRDCIALVLSDSDRRGARSRDGSQVRILATLIGAGDMNAIFPRRYGELNGRPWSGTFCDGEYVAFVERLDFR